MSSEPEAQQAAEGAEGGGYKPGELSVDELYWKEQYQWLLEAGYRLGSRYSPDWKPSWQDTGLEPYDCEDSKALLFAHINYATRVDTGQYVTLKKVDKAAHPDEISIQGFLTTEELLKDPDNHTVPTIAVLEHPKDTNVAFLVLPVLRRYDDPPFVTIGEAIDFISQFFTGVRFMHEHLISHGDISVNNLMIDAKELFPKGFHPNFRLMNADWTGPAVQKATRTEKPPTYYIIDFGHSQRFSSDETPHLKKAGTDLSVPEYKTLPQPVNAFFVDVYCVGNMIKRSFLDGDPDLPGRTGYHGFEFLRPLVDEMTAAKPEDRPSMADAVSKFEKIVAGLSTSTLRARCRRKPGVGVFKDSAPAVITTTILYWYNRVVYVVRRLPPIPKRDGAPK